MRRIIMVILVASLLLLGCTTRQVNPEYTPPPSDTTSVSLVNESYPGMTGTVIRFEQLNVSIERFETSSNLDTGISDVYILFFVKNVGIKSQSFYCHYITLIDTQNREFTLQSSSEEHFGKSIGSAYEIQPGLAQYTECTQQMPIGTELKNLSAEVSIWGEPVIYDIHKSQSPSTPKTCSDGTIVGECSTAKPKFCNEWQNLVNHASICGCNPGYDVLGERCEPS